MPRGLTIMLVIMMSLLWKVTSVYAQVRGIDLFKNKKKLELAFEMEQGFIIVDFWLKGIMPMRMIFDTGAENTILFDSEGIDLFNIPYDREIQLTGSDLDSSLTAYIVRNVDVGLNAGAIVKRDLVVLKENTLLLNEKLGTEIHGILGGSFFSNIVVKIDYQRKVITMIHPDHFSEPGGKYEKFDLRVIANKPYLRSTVDIAGERPLDLTLLLDTGAALPFLLHMNTDSTLTLPSKIMAGNVGYGLSGVLYGYRGKTNLLSFGGFHFDQITTSFQDLDNVEYVEKNQLLRNGILGNILLSRFIVIIDYTRQKLYLKAKRNYNRGFSFDKSGITLFAVGHQLNQYYVVGVINDSPAARAGVRPGDIIKKIGRRKAKNVSLEFITNKFSRKEGKKVKLTLLRQEEETEVEFLLEEWFSSPNN